jgi:serine/threonine-protein kinase
MYEIFTGKRPYEAATFGEMARLREKSAPAPPSTQLKEIDPLVERVMLRCLDKDPAKRPATALQVAAALPGGDPLAAALAAGETPSPEMVAAAGENDGLRPAIAWGCLLLIVLGLAATAVLSQKTQMINLVPLPSPPEVLAAKARDMAHEFGYTAAPIDTAYSFEEFSGYLDYIKKNDRSLTRWNNLSSGVPPTIMLWYRESPQFMSSGTFSSISSLEPDDPPNSISGMCQILLDTRGHLLKFEAVPPQLDNSTKAATAPNWSALFAAAGLDATRFKAVSPQWTPLAATDARAAWEGTWPGHPELPLRVEAAAYGGKPVYFKLVSPWTKPDRMQEDQTRPGESIQIAILLTMFFSIILLGIVLARNNIRSGRGDRRGAARLALLAFSLFWVPGFLFAHHIPTLSELTIFLIATGWGLILGAIAWLSYVALEPHVRKRWPTSLISWSRLLAGQIRDPLVGRDLVVGILTGVFWAVGSQVEDMMPGWIGKMALPPNFAVYESLSGIRNMIEGVLQNLLISVLASLGVFFIFFLMRVVMRKQWVAILVTVLLVSSLSAFGDHPVLDTSSSLVVWSIGLAVLIRFGLLALVVALCTNNILGVFPLTAHLSAWYAEPTIFLFVLILSLTVFGFYTSTAGKKLFGEVSLDG